MVPPARYPGLLATLPVSAAIVAISAGVLVLVGWAQDLETLKRVLPRLVAMNPTTALLFILSGAALLLIAKPGPARLKFASRALAGVVAFVALIKFVDVFANWLPNVDTVLFAAKLQDVRDHLPNRMAPNTALNFLLVGLALATVNAQRKRFSFSQALAILVGFGALLPITGYAYGTRAFQGHPAFIPMAIHTAVVFLILALGVFFVSRSAPLTQVFLSNEPSGILARRLFPLAVILTLCLGWIRLWGERHDLYDNEFGTALFAIALSILLAFLVRWAIWTIGRLEEERAAANLRLQELNRRKDEMIAVVSHDLCSPLTGFRMVIDLLRENPAEASGELLDLMDHSAKRMVSMVRGLLDVAKLQSNAAALEFGDVIVSEVIRESMEPLRMNANAKHIRLELVTAPDEPVIRADRLRVSQIFNNLLSNAVKFTSDGGEVTVTVAKHGKGVRAKVLDTGLGIPQTDLPHVFDKFYQASTKSTAGETGTGLGLAIVRELVLRHGGRIEVDSAVNRGTTFTLFLPAEPPPQAALNPETGGPRSA
jgi:signal transduction histidine kinase